LFSHDLFRAADPGSLSRPNAFPFIQLSAGCAESVFNPG
jgi:hypothetical protein